MATKTAKDSSGGAITFSRGASATAEGVSNAAKQGIINNVQTSGGKAVKGSTRAGKDVSGQSIAIDPNETANVLKEAADFNATPNPFQPAPVGPGNVGVTPYQSQGFTQKDLNDPTLYNDRGEAVDKPTYLAQGGKADFSNVQKAYQAATTSGVAAPQTGGEARSLMGQYMPPETANLGVAEQQLAQDPDYQALLQTKKEFADVANQRQSLTQEYSALAKKLGINELNTELMNMKNIIEGTEEDIRNEVTKAGGFATESQVQAMTFARNKQQIKNYNNLLETKQMAMEQLNTMVNLAAQDRQFAMQAISQKLQIETQIMEYKDKMKQNAVAGFERIVSRMGYDGLAQMTNGDPYYTSMIEKTMGLGTGGLAKLSAIDAQNKDKAEQERQLDIQLKQAQIGSANRANRPQPKAPNTQIVDDGGKKILVTYDDNGNIIKESPIGGGGTTSPQQLAVNQSNINQISQLTKQTDSSNAVGTSALSRLNLANMFTGSKSNFIAGVEQIRGQLTLDALSNAKARGATFGALSEGELGLLQSSASKIGSWAVVKDNKVVGYKTTASEFNKELDKINNFAKYDYVLKGGDPASVGIQVMPDGSLVTKNSDGTFTKF